MNYFGTDGIRGNYPNVVSQEVAYRLGNSLASTTNQCTVLIARDTRVSGEALFSALAQGVHHGGGTAINLGILPTNGVAHFVRKLGGDYAVMISASHNQPTDNGLKVFDKRGQKLPTTMQLHISRVMDNVSHNYLPSKVYEPVFYNIENIYIDDLLNLVPTKAYGLRVAVDCAYGATANIARRLFSRCNVLADCYYDQLDGSRINVNCGATNPQIIADAMDNCHLAFSYDGDGDRIAVAEDGQVIDNNAIMLCLAKYLKEKGGLMGNTVVGTALTNGGLIDALNELDISFVASKVGDSNVASLMRANGYALGGEQSGHYILSQYATTSDSLLVSLLLINIYLEHGSLVKYSSNYVAKPSGSVNIDSDYCSSTVKDSYYLSQLSNGISSRYPSNRVVLRLSGTENKLRCYAEGEQYQDILSEVVATIAGKELK